MEVSVEWDEYTSVEIIIIIDKIYKGTKKEG